jgi:WD40 repeat protein
MHGVFGLAFSRDGSTVASGGYNQAVRLWDVATGKKFRELQPEPPAAVLGVAFAPDGKTLVLASEAGTQLWDPAKGKVVAQVKEGQATAAAFSRDGKTLVLCPSAGGEIPIVNPATGGTLRRLPSGLGSLFAVALSPDGLTLACAGAACNIRVLNVADGKDRLPQLDVPVSMNAILGRPGLPLPPGVKKGDYVSLAFSRDRRVVAFSDGQDNVHVWDMKMGKEVQRLVLGEVVGLVTGMQLALSPDGALLAVAKSDFVGGWPSIALWDWAACKKLWQNHGHQKHSSLEGLTFSPDGRSLATGSYDEVCVWETATGGCRLRLPVKHESFGLTAFSPDGRLLAASPREMWWVALSDVVVPRRYQIESWGRSAAIHLWDLTTAQQIRCFTGHWHGLRELAFFDAGRKLASTGAEGTALIWAVPQSARTEAKDITPEECEKLWASLAVEMGKDAAATAYAAQCTLIGAKQTATFLKKRLPPVPHAQAAKVAAFRTTLNSDKWAVRQQAVKDLKQMGTAAEGLLCQLLDGNPALEQRLRVQPLLDALYGPSTWPERLRLLRALEVLERIGDDDARALVEALANGAPGAWLTVQAGLAQKRLPWRFTL